MKAKSESAEASGISYEDFNEPNSSEAAALEYLRAIRPAIERSRDRRVVDDYNAAIKELNRGMRYDGAVDNRTPAERVADAEFQRRYHAEANPDTSCGKMARQFHRRTAKEGQAAYEEMSRKMGAGFRRMLDTGEEESYEEICQRRRRELLGR